MSEDGFFCVIINKGYERSTFDCGWSISAWLMSANGAWTFVPTKNRKKIVGRMENASLLSTASHVPENALQAISISQFIFSSTNGLTLVAIILLVIAEYSSERINISSLWLILPLAISVLLTTATSFYRVLRRNELGATLAEWKKYSKHKFKVLRRGVTGEIMLKASQLVPGDLVYIYEKDVIPADMQMVSGSCMIDEGSAVVEKKPVNRKIEGSSQQNSEQFLFKGGKVVKGEARGLVVYCGDETATSRKYDTILQGDLMYFYKRVLALTGIVSVVFGAIGQWVITQSDSQYSLGDKAPLIMYLVAGILIASVPSLFTFSLFLGLGRSETRIRNNFHLYLSKLDLVTSLASIDIVAVGSKHYLVQDDSFLELSDELVSVNSGQDRSELLKAIAATLGKYDKNVSEWLKSKNVQTEFSSPLIVSRQSHTLTRSLGSTEYVCLAPQPGDDRLVFEKRMGDYAEILGFMTWPGLERVTPQTREAVSLLRTMGVEIVPVFESSMILDSRQSTEKILKSSQLFDANAVANSPGSPAASAVDPAEEPPVIDEEVSSESTDSEAECLVADEVLDFLKSGVHVSGTGSVPLVKKVMEGRQLALMSSSNLKHLLSSGDVGFCAVNLMQKLRIVANLKHVRHGITVAFLGGSEPGDRMALLASHIGISTNVYLGRSADAVIATPESNAFTSLANGILEARTCVCNVRRSMMFLLAQIVARLIPLLLSLSFSYPLALSLNLLLAGCLVMDLPVALAFIRDPPEFDLPFRKPRNEKHEKMISQRMLLISIVFLGPLAAFSGLLGYFEILSDFGFNPWGMFGFSTAGVVKFAKVVNGTQEPGFPSTSGYPLDLSLDVLEGLHLCGRVGEYTALTPSGLGSISVKDRCHGPLFTLNDFNLFCYAQARNGNTEGYSIAMREKVELFVEQKNVAGVIFERNTKTTSEGLPVCGFPDGDGIYVPWGFYTNLHQPTVDRTFRDYSCSATDVKAKADGLSVCFTAEAVYYAQTVYFAASTFFAICAAILILRTELFSFFHIGFINHNWAVPGACLLSLGLLLVLIFVEPVADAIGARTIRIGNLFAPSFPFIMLAFWLEEIRKKLIRRRTPTGHWLMQKTMW